MDMTMEQIRCVNLVIYNNPFIQGSIVEISCFVYLLETLHVYNMEMLWLWQMKFILLIHGLYMSSFIDQSLYSIHIRKTNV